MNKKILLGSVGAVVIIVLAGFTSVVGVNSTSLSVGKVTPLFNLRTEKAINDENKDATTIEYVGEGQNTLLIPYIKSMFETLEKTDTYDTGWTCIPTDCSPIYCLFWNIVWYIVFIVIFSLLDLCETLGCKVDSQFSQLNQKINGNPYLTQLITNHPDLLPEIMALNS